MQNSSFLWCVDGELSFMTSGTRRCSFEASECARILLTRLVFRSTNYLSLHFLFYILFNLNSCFNESTGRIVFEVLMFDNASKRATLTIHSSRAKVWQYQRRGRRRRKAAVVVVVVVVVAGRDNKHPRHRVYTWTLTGCKPSTRETYE